MSYTFYAGLCCNSRSPGNGFSLYFHFHTGVSMCFASGDPHYKTFDGEMLHFQGKCKYNMVSPKSTATDMPDFKVYVRNEHRHGDTHTTYTKYVEVHVSGKKIVIGREKKTVFIDDSFCYIFHHLFYIAYISYIAVTIPCQI